LGKERGQGVLAALRGGQLERGIASIVRKRQHLGKERSILVRGRRVREQEGVQCHNERVSQGRSGSHQQRAVEHFSVIGAVDHGHAIVVLIDDLRVRVTP
jgi:hypothetical protein